MGEAKRRKELGILPREKNLKLRTSDRYLEWLQLANLEWKNILIGVATMALGTIIFNQWWI